MYAGVPEKKTGTMEQNKYERVGFKKTVLNCALGIHVLKSTLCPKKKLTPKVSAKMHPTKVAGLQRLGSKTLGQKNPISLQRENYPAGLRHSSHIQLQTTCQI